MESSLVVVVIVAVGADGEAVVGDLVVNRVAKEDKLRCPKLIMN